ncbi:Replication protein [Xenorhabdus sp. XENO-1]|uniref:Replication protein n=1 Tax=Xenorhabdus bovienii TaxID=40576 RepID=UPI0020CA5F4F|nr:Replication protein [Xenorhabdus bovienii]MCP9269161.1 Replication protein [Xenorhabdus bovienii subsp. africana]
MHNYTKPEFSSNEKNQQRSRRGESNAQRRGQSKIHRRYTPKIDIAVPRGTPSKLAARLKSHNWHVNPDLIELRRRGYIPYTQRNNPHFVPKPMRISARSESCEALTSLSIALAANADFNPSHDYLFEIMAPFEFIADVMGMKHIYDNGRKAYDSPLSAMSVMEQMKFLLVLRGKDPDSGHNKPLRIWLTEKFFTSRGILRDEIKGWLKQFQTWAIEKGLTETLQRKHKRHLDNMTRIGIDLENKHSLRNRLKQIKRWAVGQNLDTDIAEQKKATVKELKGHIRKLEYESLDEELNRTQRSVNNLQKNKCNPDRPYWKQFIAWEQSKSRLEVIKIEIEFGKEHPGLLSKDPEKYYQVLLTKVGWIVD